MGCDDEPEGFRFIVIAEAQDAGERPDGIEVVEGRYCDACAVLVGLISADGTLRPVEDRARIYGPETPLLYDCGHGDERNRYRKCPTCGYQLIDHGARDTAHSEEDGPTFTRVAGPCPGCAERVQAEGGGR